MEHTSTPWNACRNGECSCKQIWSQDYPVAEVHSGKWGDTFPSLRLVGDSSLDLKAEPFIDQITYGEISEELAQANAAFIVRACNSHDELVSLLDEYRFIVGNTGYSIEHEVAQHLWEKAKAALAKAKGA